MRLMCLGFGYTARTFVARYASRFLTISATFRDPQSEPGLRNAGVIPVPSATSEEGHLLQALQNCDVVLVSAGPDEAGDPFLSRVMQAVEGSPSAPMVLYLSTVGVYGDHKGAWVDETSATLPTSKRSQLRLAAEQGWLRLGRDTGASVQIFRLAGIYGPGQNALVNLRAGTAKRIVKPGQVFNRIHVEDIATVLAAALERGGPGAIWNVADNEPAPPQEVVAYAAGLLGVPPPPEIPFESAVLSPMARSFYGENKRVSNRAIREVLTVVLRFPSYREGLSALLKDASSAP